MVAGAFIGLLTIIVQNIIARSLEKKTQQRVNESHSLLNSGHRVNLLTIVRLCNRRLWLACSNRALPVKDRQYRTVFLHP
jgi:hypothetical protein